jgi:immune inhibitor A
MTKNGAQALIVILPDKEVSTDIADPYAGTMFYYSGAGNNLDNLMYQEVTLPASAAGLTAQVNYATEEGFDFAYVVVSDDDGATWETADTNLSDAATNFGIDGSSGGNWVPLTADLTPWNGQTVLVGFNYQADSSVVEIGFMADDITIGTNGPFGAEVDDGFTFDPATDGFRATTGQETAFYFNAYIAEFRQYNGYDAGLKNSPYNFGFLDNPALQDWTERFKYQKGLLIWYWDTSFSDNNTSQHPGGGMILPVDSHPTPMYRLDGVVWRSRIQSFDSPFGTNSIDRLVIHRNSQRQVFSSKPGVPVFDDDLSWWNAATPLAGVDVPHTGTTIRATGVNNFYMMVYLNQ